MKTRLMETQALVDHLRQTGAEPTDVEVKAARVALPKSLPETISAFANGHGGTILLGLDEETGFKPVEIKPKPLRDALAQMAIEQMEPPVRGDINIDVVDQDRPVVRFDVPEMDPQFKPCFIKSRGRYQGSYYRGGDGDRRLTWYEVDRLLENQTPPVFDRQPVTAATQQDLDPQLVTTVLNHMRSLRPRAFNGLSDADALRRLNVLVQTGDQLHPTLAGLLALGQYPQQSFPQLSVSAVVVPGIRMGEAGPGGERFLDSASIDGPIPLMVADATRFLMRNMSKAQTVHGALRTDRWDYPLEVIRELIGNALMHRDYSPQACGTQVQVELYADRLVVRSPGGFFGPVRVEDFGEPDVSSSRNALLAALLENVPLPDTTGMVAENRGSGIPIILHALAEAGMQPPVFDVSLRRVQVTVFRDSSVGSQATSASALRALQAQSSMGAAYFQPTLKNSAATAVPAKPNVLFSSTGPALDHSLLAQTRADDMVGLIKQSGTAGVSAAQLSQALSVSRQTVLNTVNALIKAGLVEPTAPVRSNKRTYRLPSR